MANSLSGAADDIQKKVLDFESEIADLGDVYRREATRIVYTESLIAIETKVVMNHFIDVDIKREYPRYSDFIRQTLSFEINGTYSNELTEGDAKKELAFLVDLLNRYKPLHDLIEEERYKGGKKNA